MLSNPYAVFADTISVINLDFASSPTRFQSTAKHSMQVDCNDTARLDSFPHILDAIIAPIDDSRLLLSLRRLSWGLYHAVNRRLLKHLVLDTERSDHRALRLMCYLGDARTAIRAPVDKRILEWISKVPRWFVDYEWPRDRLLEVEAELPVWEENDFSRHRDAESPRPSRLSKRRPRVCEMSADHWGNREQESGQGVYVRRRPPAPVLVADMNTQARPDESGQPTTLQMEVMSRLPALPRHLSAAAAAMEALRCTRVLDVTATAARRRGTRLLLRLCKLSVIRSVRLQRPQALMSLDVYTTLPGGPETVVIIDERNRSIDWELALKNAERTSFRPRVFGFAPRTVAVTPFAITAARTLVVNTTRGLSDRIEIPSVSEVVVILPSPSIPRKPRSYPPKLGRARRWYLHRTAIIAVSFAAEVFFSGREIGITMVGMPILPPVDIDSAVDDILDGNYDIYEHHLLCNFGDELSTASPETKLQLRLMISWKTVDEYRALVGDEAFAIASDAQQYTFRGNRGKGNVRTGYGSEASDYDSASSDIYTLEDQERFEQPFMPDY